MAHAANRNQNTLERMATPVILAGAAVFAAVYFELFLEQAYPGGLSLREALLSDWVSWPIARLLILFVAILVAFCALNRANRALHWVFRYRFPLAVGSLVLLVVFQISGSSVSLWADYLGNAEGSDGLLFGIARPIRTDEWQVFTPFALSQSYTGYAGISDIIRGGGTDVTMVYGQPAWALATLFRPFLWGYLLLGSSYGLSFFWCGRLIALFLVTFECARLYTRDNHRMSAAVAVIVTFSPVVQWWFAVNGTAELLIFGQLLVIGLGRFLQGGRSSLVAAALMPWFAGCYLLILYPAWQVPFFYVFAAMGVWQVLCWHRGKPGQYRSRISRRSIIVLAVSLVVVILLIAVSLYQARDVIAAVSGTAYPGKRNETGGGLLEWYFDYGFSAIFAIDAMDATPNISEITAFFSLAPAGMFLALYAFVARKRDILLGVLLVVQALFLVYGFFGLPELFCKVLLLSNVTTSRLVMAIGFVDIVLLVRALVVLREVPGRKASAILVGLGGFGAGLCGCLANSNVSPGIVTTGLMVMALVLTAVAAIHVLLGRRGCDAALLAVAVAVVGVSGFCVNPIQQGTSFLDDQPLLQTIQQVADEYGSGSWISDTHTDGQAILLAGEPSINSVNVYPNLAQWERVDSDGEYADVYNRYASIETELQDECETNFEIIVADQFKVNINIDDLKTLGVSYILTTRDYSSLESSQVSLTEIATSGAYRVYEVCP